VAVCHSGSDPREVEVTDAQREVLSASDFL